MKYFQSIIYLFLVPFLLSPISGFAEETNDLRGVIENLCPEGQCEYKSFAVDEDLKFTGLASYYNETIPFIVDSQSIQILEFDTEFTLNTENWLVLAGRFKIFVIRAPELIVQASESGLFIKNLAALDSPNAIIKRSTKTTASTIAPELSQLRYNHLWAPFAWVARAIEFSLTTIIEHITSSWGMAIIILSVILKVLLLPIGIWTRNLQRSSSIIQEKLEPILTKIKKNYDGEEAHNRLMAAYKDLGVSPFYSLKPIMAPLIQLPILIGVFNALGEMPQFEGQPFLWISNLAYPDTIAQIPFSIPLLGNAVNVMPFLMTIITIFATLAFQNSHASDGEIKRQKRNLYLMAAAFFILFYPFPASMVIYWTMANILQSIQQKFIKI